MNATSRPSLTFWRDFFAILGVAAAIGSLIPQAERRCAKNLPPSSEPEGLQAARALEPGRGRSAEKPTDIPSAGWRDIFWRTVSEVSDDRLLAIAAGSVFYGLLALFPAVTAIVASYSLFASPATISNHLSTLASMLPPGAFSVIEDQIRRVLAKSDETLSWTLVISIGVAIWGANAGVKALIDALNVVYDEDEKRTFIKLNLLSLLMTAGALVAVLFAIAALVVLPPLLERFAFGPFELVLSLARWPLLLIGTLLGLAVLYRFGPSRKEAKWRWLTPGALVAAFFWLAASALLSWYFANFADYDAAYGTLGGLMALLMWMWLSAIVILVGAELNAEIEHQTAKDTTQGAPKPLGARGATMADTVGKASD